MRIASIITGVLLGLLFIASGIVVLLNLAPTPQLPPDSAIAHFMAGFGPTGYLKFVKVLEVLGGLLLAIPKTRRIGLLILGPIIVNILAFRLFVTAGEGLLSPTLLVICAMTLFLVWVERRAFAAFLYSPSGRQRVRNNISTEAPTAIPMT
jgi:putative oxidoreductase